MVEIIVENFSEEELIKRWNELNRKERDWDKECEMCQMPEMLHTGACTRKTEIGEAEFSELFKSWSVFR